MLHPEASVRPVITKRSCTSPSLVPLALCLKRASRTGPFCVMNHGTVFFAPFKVATAINGFSEGLDPPALGWAWQERHWFELKRGPSPLFAPLVTTSTSANLACPSWKNAVSSAVRALADCQHLPGHHARPGLPGLICFDQKCRRMLPQCHSNDSAETLECNTFRGTHDDYPRSPSTARAIRLNQLSCRSLRNAQTWERRE